MDEEVYSLLMRLCPEMIRPFAEVMLPSAIAQMEPEKKQELRDQLLEYKDRPEQDQAQMLILFAKSMGADPSIFAQQMPELAEYFS